jgi:glycosyltransferase involved in cell wall biosynthesis
MEKKLPIFSVIVATYRRPSQRLRECLTALANQTYPHNLYEVIIVDDGSPISSRELVETFRCDLRIELLVQSRTGPAAARNNGARHATGEYLAFTDDDCAPAPDWLERLAERFAKYPVCVIGGRRAQI